MKKKKNVVNRQLMIALGALVVVTSAIYFFLKSQVVPANVSEIRSATGLLGSAPVDELNNPEIPSELDALAVKTETLYTANFLDISETTHSTYYSDGGSSRIYSGEPFGRSGGSLYLEITEAPGVYPEDLMLTVPYVLPTNKLNTTELYARILPDSGANAWLRLRTNVIEDGYFKISLHPQTQAYELIRYYQGNTTTLRSGQSDKIRPGTNYNFLKVIRNPKFGGLEVLVNGTSLFKINDKTLVGGVSQLEISAYDPDVRTLFTKFKIY